MNCKRVSACIVEHLQFLSQPGTELDLGRMWVGGEKEISLEKPAYAGVKMWKRTRMPRRIKNIYLYK